jgi:DNA-directed RNA polymerase subunit RPC12/RpoP
VPLAGKNNTIQRYADAPRLKRHHETVHLKLRPHECTQCGKKFGTSGDLRRHVRTVHNKERRFACAYCSLRFSRADNMHEHIRSVHSGGSDNHSPTHTSRSLMCVTAPHSSHTPHSHLAFLSFLSLSFIYTFVCPFPLIPVCAWVFSGEMCGLPFFFFFFFFFSVATLACHFRSSH